MQQYYYNMIVRGLTAAWYYFIFIFFEFCVDYAHAASTYLIPNSFLCVTLTLLYFFIFYFSFPCSWVVLLHSGFVTRFFHGPIVPHILFATIFVFSCSELYLKLE